MLPVNNPPLSTGNVSFYRTTSIDNVHNNYLSEWVEWTKNSISGENRETAFTRLQLCLENSETSLDLSCLGLRSLPRLPDNLDEINVSNNQLSMLPELPRALKELNASSNQLSALPELPVSLEYINVSDNHLFALPELPASLEYINVSDNHLSVLPRLPMSLELLDAARNALEVIPDFPERDDHIIRIFWLNQNRITAIPESILGLSSDSVVNLRENQLSPRIMQTLLQQTAQPDYHGPQIYFSMSDGQQNTLHRPLADAVTAWFPENKQSDVSQIWHAFEHEEHANTFSAFLDRLSDTVSARNTSGFREQVAAWLEKLSASAELRQQSFAVAADATESCEDRVALTWNNLRKTLLVHQASEGLFDNDTGALLSLGREMFRLEILEDIARDKVRTLHFVDEIEVYLAFQTMLAEKLQLSTAVKEMRFYGVSGVTANDLRTAEAMVRSREENEFKDWFSLWGPWHAVLKRTEADRWALAEEQKYEMLENEYPQRVADRLKASGLSGDADAEREAGAQVMRETEQQIYRQLTDEVLALRLPENGSQLHHS
ncbi:T3SS effector E3 ubiquitin-protein ligase IpaHe [Shigella flexneri]|uniref:T3SS effector E3 ubiquitin-protein ligase IpaHe n=1 Tax=Shigella TaxID=620 RepID=UPI00057C14C6|nr:NEL-type E3 ubiquitin ligase domain-containing protein [Shigella boydii]